MFGATKLRSVLVSVIALLLALIFAACGSKEPAAPEPANQPVTTVSEEYEAVCLNESGYYVDFSECAPLEEDGDFSDYDDYTESAGSSTSNGFFLGFVVASLLRSNPVSYGQSMHSYARQLPANATLVTPNGGYRLSPGSSLSENEKKSFASKLKAKKPARATAPTVAPKPAQTVAPRPAAPTVAPRATTAPAPRATPKKESRVERRSSGAQKSSRTTRRR